MDVSTVRRWMACFSSGNSDVKDKPYSRQPCTAVTPRNEEHLNQLIRVNRQITTRELSLNGSSPLCAKNITKNIKDIR